jgi:serpin B
MMSSSRTKVGLLLLVALGSFASASNAAPMALAESIGAFGCDLYQAVRHREGNLFFSPYSISTTLAMLRAGAAGETASQMDAVLHLPSQDLAKRHRQLAVAIKPPLVPADAQKDSRDIPAYELNVAQALWGQEDFPFLEDFLEVLKYDYRAPLFRVDFTKPGSARQRINAWVGEQTRERIRNIIPEGEPDPDTRLALANAIHLKASWKDPFKEARTAQAPFTTSEGSQATARFMHRTGYLDYAATEDVQVLSLPYREGRLSMVILLPRKTRSLATLEEHLDREQLAAWLAALRRTNVHVALPRFEFDDSFDLTDTLAAMGMRYAFEPDQADFSKMSAVDLSVGLVLHQAFVGVDEKGTEAAAATVALVAMAGAPLEEAIEFRADHPFVFLIRHTETGTILFLGRLANPAQP